MSGMTLGKRRRLQQASGASGAFTVLAVDHRGPLRRRLAKECAAETVDGVLAEVKRDIVRTLGAGGTAILLDPELGLAACVESGALSGSTGLLIALDTGSTGDPAILKTGLAEGWSVRRIARSGAAGVKLLVYYHPDTAQAREVEALVTEVGAACAEEEIPLFLEPLSYDPASPAVPLPTAERERVVVETARRLTPLGADILKAEFPVHAAENPDEGHWRRACEAVTAASCVPWVLLSAGVSDDVFLRQARVACEAGSSGVMAGRSVWNEAVTADATARRSFLAGVAWDRLRALREICDRWGRPVV
ncbi:MAG: tagatose 1,6-diphosphate aldolase [Verrucomicrobiales bacterium]|nr:tagatose 1,6-diphosphate aldolase [Verrucomicrobiales bacterium]